MQVVESINTAGGALGLSLLLTAILPTALEDFLVVVLAGFFAYVSFLQWPIRRGEIKEAVAEKFGGISDTVDSELRGELAQAVGKVRSRVTAMVAPLQEQAERDLELVTARQERLKVCDAPLIFCRIRGSFRPPLLAGGIVIVCESVTCKAHPSSARLSLASLHMDT